MSRPLITRVDPHLHAGSSACSSLTDEQAVRWFEEHPEYAVVVSDHMTWNFYDRMVGATLRDRALFAIEITVDDLYDLVLLTPELAAFSALLPEAGSGCTSYREPPISVFADPRVLVVFAHPPYRRGRQGRPDAADWPAWLLAAPVDFLEFNAARYLATSPRVGSPAEDQLRHLDGYLRSLRDTFFPHARFLVGSDCHSRERLGTTFAALDSPATSPAEAWRSLRDGSYYGHLGIVGHGAWRVDPHQGLGDRIPAHLVKDH
jgi:hypothetical protein